MEPILTKNIAKGDGVTWIDAYEANGGYSALRMAVREMEPAQVAKLVSDAELRGRGGAGFPTGFKWSAMPAPADAARPRYLACNFDEMEPGTFKDRFLVEGDPHQLIEGIAIASYACQVDIAYIFVRDEYRLSIDYLRRAVAEAYDRGYIGLDAAGGEWGFELYIHVSAGRYMCGEETGLLNALEGKRANPRSKPPYPQASGLWGKPTVVQNVETLCCVPHIVERGAEWFKSLGKAKDSGTKIYGVSGKVNRPGCWELPMGTTLRELIEEHAGGMREGFGFRAALPGGASTMFLTADEMDIPLDFSTLKPLGKALGTGTAIVLDDKTCPVGMARNLAMFYARESCGWCTPCREGLPWVEKLFEAIENGRGLEGDPELLVDQLNYIGPNSFCAFATGAMFPLVSAIETFPEEFAEHIRARGCTYKKELSSVES